MSLLNNGCYKQSGAIVYVVHSLAKSFIQEGPTASSEIYIILLFGDCLERALVLHPECL